MSKQIICDRCSKICTNKNRWITHKPYGFFEMSTKKKDLCFECRDEFDDASKQFLKNFFNLKDSEIVNKVEKNGKK